MLPMQWSDRPLQLVATAAARPAVRTNTTGGVIADYYVSRSHVKRQCGNSSRVARPTTPYLWSRARYCRLAV